MIMDYEKKYKEALERARQFSEHPLQEDSDSIAEYIFPELKESEDERIRKEIIDFIYDKTDTYELREKSNSWIAWIEKQGEQKPAEWSEEDEKMYRGVMAVCDVWSTATSFYPKENEDVERLKHWLKSFKERIGG